MLKPDSPFKNIPSNTHPRQAFFLDGLRHAFEIAALAFSRLATGLSTLLEAQSKSTLPQSFAPYYLDAWAFVDSVDRLRVLWELQPGAEGIPEPFNSTSLDSDLQAIRKIRNVSDHLAQKADQIVSLNASALGELSWVTVYSLEPPIMKSAFIRPGFLPASVKFQLNIPKEQLDVYGAAANILLKAGTHTADLSFAYSRLVRLAHFAESSLASMFARSTRAKPHGTDMFASCDLEFPVR
ncbi:MAG: hypothetical protein KDH88_06000 [Chromatiales bacterium]|nr:hypothetical protein [Chromatiales bacterium]